MLSIGHYGLITTTRSDSRFQLKVSNPISIAKRPESIKFRTQTGAGKVKAYMKNGLPSEYETSFYELLGVPKSGSLVEVKHAYKQLALKYHPDMSPPGRVEEYTKRFIQVHEAYETLSDPTRRDIAIAFSSSHRHCYDDQVIEQKTEWKTRWQSQLSELKRRSNKCRDSGGNMSWATRLRQKRNEFANEL